MKQVIVALGKTIRAMADGSVDSQVGSRIANGLGIMRQCLETRTLDQLGERVNAAAMMHRPAEAKIHQ